MNRVFSPLICCVRLPTFPIDRAMRRHRQAHTHWPDNTPHNAQARPPVRQKNPHATPAVLIRTTPDRQTVVAASSAALRQGVRVGSTLPQARAACSGLLVFEHDPDADARTLIAIARWLHRFTPVIEVVGVGHKTNRPGPVQGAPICLTSHAAHPRSQLRAARPRKSTARLELVEGSPAALLLDLTGSAHLFGGPAKTLSLIHAAFIQLRLPCAIALGPNPAAAYARTFDTSPSQSGRSFDHLPARALNLPDDLLATLDHLGLQTVGLIRKLPRDALPARLGRLLLHRLDQLDGKIPQPLKPVEPFAPIRARKHWDFAIHEFPRLAPVIDYLLQQICKQLDRRCRGALLARLTLERAYETPLVRELRFARPCRALPEFKRLIDVATQQITLETTRKASKRRKVHAADDVVVPTGFVAIAIEVLQTQPVVYHQSQFASSDLAEYQLELSRLLETLTARLGPDAITRAVPVKSHLPERMWQDVRAVDTPITQQAIDNPLPWLDPPLWLHAPIEVRAVVSPSHDRDAKPVQLTWPTGQVTPIPHAVGPIRLAGEWWRDHHKTRDYFHLIDDQGQYHFAFRVLDSGRWFVQGN